LNFNIGINIYRNSLVVKYVRALFRKVQQATARCLEATTRLALTRDIRRRLESLPIATLSTILITATIVNTLFHVFFTDISAGALLARALLLLAGTLGLSCRADWQTLRDGSVILKVFK